MNKTLSILLFLTPLFFGGYSPPKKSEVHFMGFQKIEHDVVKFDNINSEIFNKVDTNLVKIFYSIQSEFGKPINISYGFRDPVTNRKVGGARNSAHIYGLALDLTLDEPSREDIKRLITLATKWNVLGIGVYRDAQILHIDIDEKKGRRAWGSTYSSNSIPSWARSEVHDHLNKIDTTLVVSKLEPVKSEKISKQDTLKKVATKNIVTKSAIKKDKTFHVVKTGDTLYSLAKSSGTTVDKLCKLNGIKGDYKIKVGQKLKLN
jgi:LysM repeat protein